MIKATSLRILALLAATTATISALEILGFELPELTPVTVEREPGMPLLHSEPKHLLGINSLSNLFLGCSNTEEVSDENDPCHHRNIALQATHAGRVKTDVPIYGVLTQPYTSDPENQNKYGGFDKVDGDALKGTFILMSHVKYLEAAGARIVPISYKLDKNGLVNLLQQVNGVYIPGDHPDVLKNERYINTVREILFWAQDQNIKDGHFPLVAVSYGYLAVMMQGIK